MKTFIKLMAISILMMVAAPAWSDSVLNIYFCQQGDEMDDDSVEAAAKAWLKAAKTVKGGENLELSLLFPVAANAGETDVAMALIAPSFGEWGTFMDNYAGSAAEEIDGKNEGHWDCTHSTLWESVNVK
jgi:hypothetical protein